MFCSNCGKNNDDKAKHCYSCGAELSIHAPQDNTPLTTTNSIDPIDSSSVTTPQSPKKNNKTALIISIISVIVAVAAIFIGVLIGTGAFQKEDGNTEKTTEQKEDSTKEKTTERKEDSTKEKTENNDGAEDGENSFKLVKIQGREYLAMTDKDGNVIVDASNRLQAIVTDSDGNIVTQENGEPQTYWVPIGTYAVIGGKYYTPDLVLGSIKGWTFDIAGILIKDKTNNNTKIQIAKVLDSQIPNIKNPTFEDYIEYKDKVDAQALPEFEKQGYKVSHKKETVSLTARNITMISYVSIIYNSDGSIFNYNETLYFKLDEETWYSIQYNSARGEGYDESFDFRAYVDNNLNVIK